MSTSAVRLDDATVARVDMKFEVVVIPVSDVDRAKEFYERLGWRLDADYDNVHEFRVIQFTPRGSGCSVNGETRLFYVSRTSLRARGTRGRRCTQRLPRWSHQSGPNAFEKPKGILVCL
jgi:catechol 2,3-dioxygenase-like lactoylglutathione lyase family enzyme